jgi:hypothetical protein
MGEIMHVLAGLRPESLARLEKRGEVVFEIISYRGIYAVIHSEEGGEIFLTTDLYEELGKGTEGVVARIVSKDVSDVRVSFDHVDEREVQRARVKVQFLRYARVREVLHRKEYVSVELFEQRSPFIL